MFWKRSSQFDIGELFNTHFTEMLDLIRPYGQLYWESYLFDFELLAFFYTLTFYYIVQFKGKKRQDLVENLNQKLSQSFGFYFNSSGYLEKRIKFYRDIIKPGFLRAEWNYGTTSTQPDIRLFIAFGDILYNPELHLLSAVKKKNSISIL